MRNNNFENVKKFMSGRGYYIALVLCAIAIGISGYMYYRTANQQPSSLSEPQITVGATLPQQDIPVIGQPTVPAKTTPAATQPQQVQKPTQPEDKTLKTASPLAGETISPYAMECLSYNPTTRDWRVHNGVDIAAEAGTQVKAAAAGKVEKVYEDDRMGFTVEISHTGGYTTCYASLDEKVLVKVGDAVKLGQPIGTVGCTALLESAVGDHLHFSVRCNGEEVDPADFLPKD